ncbi:MAG: TerD family protein, partial [Frankia sp.]|nr:TerD family protein [Frankia sp.]
MAQVLSKGANAPLPAPDVRVEISSSTALDIAALLLTPTGKVRSDADFVFFNQPTGPGVRLLPPSGLEFSLGAVPSGIDRIVVTGSIDPPRTFAQVRGLSVTVRDSRAGAEIVRFDPTGLTSETALIMVELYRRAGAWKVRAVGQGYASGLAGIATDFGITVDDPGPSATPAAAPAAPPPAPGRHGPSDAPTRVVQPPSAPTPPPAPAPPPGAPQWGPPAGAPPGRLNTTEPSA